MKEINISGLKDKAKHAAPANKKLIEKLKRTKPKDLDQVTEQLHDEAFENIDCMKCANCCKTTSPIFTPKDIDRLAKKFKIKASQFIDKYLHIDEDKDYVLNSAPCPFLDSDNSCSVYDDRPNACNEYPHTSRKRFYQVLDLTLQNTYICPAVFNVVEALHKKYPSKIES